MIHKDGVVPIGELPTRYDFPCHTDFFVRYSRIKDRHNTVPRTVLVEPKYFGRVATCCPSLGNCARETSEAERIPRLLMK